jgi:hypothetical protein
MKWKNKKCSTNQLGYGVFGYSFSAWSFPLIQSSSKVGFLILQSAGNHLPVASHGIPQIEK